MAAFNLHLQFDKNLKYLDICDKQGPEIKLHLLIKGIETCVFHETSTDFVLDDYNTIISWGPF